MPLLLRVVARLHRPTEVVATELPWIRERPVVVPMLADPVPAVKGGSPPEPADTRAERAGPVVPAAPVVPAVPVSPMAEPLQLQVLSH